MRDLFAVANRLAHFNNYPSFWRLSQDRSIKDNIRIVPRNLLDIFFAAKELNYLMYAVYCLRKDFRTFTPRRPAFSVGFLSYFQYFKLT